MDPHGEPKGRPEERGRPGQRLSPPGSELAGIGVQFALIIVVFVFGGVWLDGRLHTSPWFTIGCTFVGAAAGMYWMYRRAMEAQRGDGEDGR